MPSRRILCSHLVDVWAPGQADSPAKAILEEIEALEAVLAVERAYEPGTLVLIETGAGSPVIPGEVAAVEQRETDRLLRVSFRNGYRWRSEEWSPDHAVQIADRGEGAAAS